MKRISAYVVCIYDYRLMGACYAKNIQNYLYCVYFDRCIGTFDGNGDGRCDENSCEYVMISYSIAYDFTMPDENVTITYEITDGFLPG